MATHSIHRLRLRAVRQVASIRHLSAQCMPRACHIYVLILLVFVVGCESGAPSPLSTNGPRQPTESAPSASLGAATAGPSATEALPPEVIREPMLSCGDELLFSPTVFEGSASAESDLDPAAAVLREFLSEMHEPDDYPAYGWWRVAVGRDRVLFLAPGPTETPWLMVAAAWRADGWRIDAFGECQLSVALPDDVLAGEWWLDPAFPDPRPEEVAIHTLLRERACAGGHSPEGRVLDPIIIEDDDDVTVIAPIRRRPGPNDCAGNAAIPYTIRLSTPIGARRLLDGATLPPRDATTRP